MLDASVALIMPLIIFQPMRLVSYAFPSLKWSWSLWWFCSSHGCYANYALIDSDLDY